MSHYPITKAGLISALTFIVGQIVAFVPTLGPDKQILLSAGTAAISLGFLIANAIHALASAKLPSTHELEQNAENLVRGEIGKVDFNQLAKDAVSGQIGGLVQEEIKKLLGGAVASSATPTAAVQDPTAAQPGGTVTPLPSSPGTPPAA